MTAIDNKIYIRAPRDQVWDITNDVRNWPRLFTEYADVEVLQDGPPIIFRLTTHPDHDGKVWSWTSQRQPDRDTWSVTSQRLETGPFTHMNLRWDYAEHGDGTIMRWRQEFEMKPEAPFTTEQMRLRLDAGTTEQMAAVRSGIEQQVSASRAAREDLLGSEHARRLLLLTCGSRLQRMIEVLVQVGVPDIVGDDPEAVVDIADRVAASPHSLYRILRCLASIGIFHEGPAGSFRHSDLSKFLTVDHLYSLTPLIRHSGSQIITGPYSELREAMYDEPRRAQSTLGTDVWTHLAAHPDQATAFDDAMVKLGAWETDRHVAAVQPQRYEEIVDIGGGAGHFLCALLAAAPSTTGVLVESDRALRAATELLASRDMHARTRMIPADALQPLHLPARPHRAVILKAVLHNWNDAEAEQILRHAADLIDETGAVFLIEQVVSESEGFDHAKWLDIDMMLTFGGRERTRDQWAELLTRSGLQAVRPLHAQGWGVIECTRRNPA